MFRPCNLHLRALVLRLRIAWTHARCSLAIWQRNQLAARHRRSWHDR